MKKVRYAIGAAGVVPALGLMMPAANAATATAQAPAKPGKTVSLLADQVHAAPQIVCGTNQSKRKRLPTAPFFTERVFYSHTAGGGQCVSVVFDSIQRNQTHLAMRTRIYSKVGGVRRYSTYVNGFIGGINGPTDFSVLPRYDDAVHQPQVCTALVSNSFHSVVKYGPICLSI